MDKSRSDSLSHHQEELVVGGEVVKVEANSLIPLARAHYLPTIQPRPGQERVGADISYAYQTRKRKSYKENIEE